MLIPARVATIALGVLGCLITSCSFVRGEAPRELTEVPGTNDHVIHVGGTERSFLLHVPLRRPRRLRVAQPYPLVIVLHGSGASGETIRRMSGMDSLADTAHFVVAYPNALGHPFRLRTDWNAGDCCGPASDEHIDDIAFIRTLIDSVAASMPIDRNRIYVAGFSDGGRMSYRVGCEMSSQVAAIAVVAGSIVVSRCSPARPMPLIAFHGTADEDVPYSDSSHTTIRTPSPVAAKQLPPSVQAWSALNRCKGVTERQQSPHVSLAHFDQCAADLSLFTITGGMHAWPGGVTDGQEPTHEIVASVLAWHFFVRHPLH